MKFLFNMAIIISMFLVFSCNKKDETPVQCENIFQPEIILEQTIQTNVENMGTALNSVFITLIADSTERAHFAQTLLQPLTYFDSGEGFFFIESLNGYLIADHSLPDMLGSYRYDLQDVNGVYLVRDMIEVARYSSMGWVNYSFNNPITGFVEAKRSAVKLMPEPGWFIASGYYESQMNGVPVMTTSAFNDFMYRELVNTFAKVLSNLTQAYSPESDFFLAVTREMVHHMKFGIDYSGYFFVYNMEGIVVAHGATPSMEGTDMIDYQDANGVYVTREIIQMLEASGSCYIDYDWENPSTGTIELKHAYMKQVTGTNLWVGSGIYLE